ncbi:MAG TPA: helix-turn-helix transcriptional regulator [Candidatus Angelobacter sp.]|jgi:transcriptional regulator with XRE-family HTH domain|nr:helix-turn-helix transcriptional regulator [Candidatus Angelobacter sp.]
MGRPVAPLKRKTDTREAALGAVITELRVKKGWGYEEVAHRVGCNPGYMSDIERGKKNPSIKIVQAIADVHGIKLSKLFAMAERKYERGRR